MTELASVTKLHEPKTTKRRRIYRFGLEFAIGDGWHLTIHFGKHKWLIWA